MRGKKTLRLTPRYYRWYPSEAHLGYTEEAVCLDLDETAFLLVDVYCAGPQQPLMERVVGDKYMQLWYRLHPGQRAVARGRGDEKHSAHGALD